MLDKTPFKGAQRSETISARLDPKVRYLLELASRSERRSISNMVEIAIEKLLSDIELQNRFEKKGDSTTTLEQHADFLCEGDFLERLAKLGIFYPHLLSHQEKELWEHVVRCGLVPDSYYKASFSREKVWIEMRDNFMPVIRKEKQQVTRWAHADTELSALLQA